MKILILILVTFVICGCSVPVEVNTSNKGEGPLSTNVLVYEEGTIVASKGTNSDGRGDFNLGYGKYEVTSNKEGYQESKGTVKVDLWRAMFGGVSVDLTMVRKDGDSN